MYKKLLSKTISLPFPFADGKALVASSLRLWLRHSKRLIA